MHQNDVKLIIHVHKHQTRKGQCRIKKICVGFPFFWLSWILNFSFPDTASVHTYLVNPAYESALQSGNFWIRYAGSGIVWTLNSDILSGDVTRSRPVLYREYCIRIQDGNLIPRISLLPALRRMLCCHYFPKSPCTRVNPDTCRTRVACERQTFLLARRSQARMRVDGQIRFEYGYVWTRKFLNPQRKICGLKNIRIRYVRLQITNT